MKTELDIGLLKESTPLGCAHRLTELTCAELWAICTLLGLRAKRKTEKSGLAGRITAHLHPAAAASTMGAQYRQESLLL